MTAPSAAARTELTPTGKLRVGLNMSNFLLTAKDAAGAPIGLAPDLGRELGKRLGVEVELVPYPNPGALADDANKGKWDVGFLGAEPQRANEIDFTAAYVEIEATYLLPPGSTIKSIAEVDTKGKRIAVPERSAYELYLTRSLKNAELVRIKGGDARSRPSSTTNSTRSRDCAPGSPPITATSPAHASSTATSLPYNRQPARPKDVPPARNICASTSRTSKRPGWWRRPSRKTRCAG